MSTSNHTYGWLESLLLLLFDRLDRQEALRALRDSEERACVMRRLSGELVTAGMPAGMLETDEGANLFVAVLALRVKFPREDALAKVRLNIAMREGRA
jgi:hypothetical protein